MEIKNVVEITILLEYYGNLLTEKQSRYLIEHIDDDYSLSEIAKAHSVSRQAVYDQIKKGIKQLYLIEEKLNIVKRDSGFKEAVLALALSKEQEETLLKLL